jgi:ubiquinone/menaquinone biosynthesis C-methylase UbiE
MGKNKKIDHINKSSYVKKNILKYYSINKDLWESEKTIFEKYKHYIIDKKILDVGCGGGRTTEHLRKLSKKYIGIDYCQEMIASCKKQYPDLIFLQSDARDMSVFKDHEFDFVIFSGNGIDSIDYNGRIKSLKEISRVLKHEGLFAFSSHNLNFKGIPFEIPMFNSFNPKILFKNIVKKYNHYKYKKFEIHSNGYSILNDPAHGFSFLVFYVEKDFQIRLLEEIGIKNIEVIASDGIFSPTASQLMESPYLYYLGWKE